MDIELKVKCELVERVESISKNDSFKCYGKCIECNKVLNKGYKLLFEQMPYEWMCKECAEQYLSLEKESQP